MPPLARNLLLALFVLLLRPSTSARVCGRKCNFRLCDAKGTLLPIGPAIIQRPKLVPPFSPVICRADETVRLVLRTGEAVLERPRRNRVPISQWDPRRLSKRFPRFFFRAAPVPELSASAIVKLRSKGNQEDFLQGLCLRLPVLRYRRKGRRGMTEVVDTAGGPNDCVSFRVETSKLLVELSWTSGDDFDLAVIQPDGQLLSRFNERTSNGGVFGEDAGVCMDKNSAGMELARYDRDATVLKGRYLVQVRHFDNCGRGATRWTLRVSLGARLLVSRSERSNEDGDVLLNELTFRVS